MKSGTKGFFLGAIVMIAIFTIALRTKELKSLCISLINIESTGGNKNIQ